MAVNVDTTCFEAEWKKAFSEGLLTTEHFKKYWNYWVRELYYISGIKVNLKEGVDEELLTIPLEDFICAGDSHNITEASSSVCCKVFEEGDITFKCIKCMETYASILCVDCFNNSKHKDHDYKICMAVEGEYCSCGIADVWTQDSFCNSHMPSGNEDQHIVQDYCTERARIIFDSVFEFACEFLLNCHDHLEHTENLCDIYSAMLYDDESYNFRNIMNIVTVLHGVTEDSRQEVFRTLKNEGRVLIHSDSFKECKWKKYSLDMELSRFTDTKILVQHAYTTISQVVSLKLLTWLENFLRKRPVFCSVFAEIVLNSDSKTLSYFQKVFTCGNKMWTKCGFVWHKVFVSGMMQKYDNKIVLANEFAKHYSLNVHFPLYSHSTPFCSLVTQLFMVPSISLHLIVNNNMFYTVLEPIREFFIQVMTIQEPTMTNNELENKLDIIKDFNYLLHSLPGHWNDSLRESFLHGIKSMLLILTEFHGFDSITRQEDDHHVEYEKDFSTGFQIQRKLSHSILYVVECCRSDKILLSTVYNMVLEKLYEKRGTTDDRNCDVSEDSVSIHLSLSRLLAALSLELGKYDLTFTCMRECSAVPITLVDIIEPVLRCQVFFAQVNAGLWAKNGLSVKHLTSFYKDVSVRTGMLDCDVILLQLGASSMEDSNSFFLHVFSKFLKNWTTQHMDETVFMLGKFLDFLLIIIGERHVPGVSNITNEDRVENEIIQRLCIKSLSYWQLVEAIPPELLQNVDLDKLIKKLTNAKKDSNGIQQHELKSQYFDHYNMFFYHYTNEEMLTSEMAQRLRRGMGFCPPSKLLKLSDSFSSLVNLLQCNEMLEFLKDNLEKCVNLKNIRKFEDNLQKLLYLIGYALHEEQSKYYPSFKFTEKSAEFGIFSLLRKLSRHPEIDASKGLLQWTIDKYKEVTKNTINDMINIDEEEGVDVNIDNISEKERRKNLAEKRRKEILQGLAANGDAFLKNNSKLYQEISCSQTSKNSLEPTDSLPEQVPVALGPPKTITPGLEKTYTCFLCKEEDTVSSPRSTLIVPVFMQESTVLRQYTYNELFTDASAELNMQSVIHINTCGHVVHNDCYYQGNIWNGAVQTRKCPLCQSLTNTTLPFIPHLKEVETESPSNKLNFDTWLRNNMILIEDLKKESPVKPKRCNLVEEHERNSDLTSMISLYLYENYHFGSKSVRVCADQSVLNAFKSLSYNLRCIEILLGNATKALLGELSSRQSICIEAQIGIARVLGQDRQKFYVLSLSSKKCTLIRIFEKISKTPSIFQMDLLSVLIYLTFSLPTIYTTCSQIPMPTGDTLDYYILRFVFIMHIIQILSTLDVNLLINGSSNIQKPVIHEILDVLKIMLNQSEEGLRVWNSVQNASLPFLRCCVLFYHHLSGVKAHSSLFELEGDTFINMCKYLNLPQTPEELFGSSEIMDFVKVWCNHKYPHTPTIPRPIRPQNVLINLPKYYSELLNISSAFFCSSCNKTSNRPTVCLLCEEILCCDYYCPEQYKNIGACQNHTLHCSAGVGMFLSIKQCQLLYVTTSNRIGSFSFAAPYIDAHGSTDQGLRRGNPLTLCSKRYNKLETVLLSHDIYQEVSNGLERAMR